MQFEGLDAVNLVERVQESKAARGGCRAQTYPRLESWHQNERPKKHQRDSKQLWVRSAKVVVGGDRGGGRRRELGQVHATCEQCVMRGPSAARPRMCKGAG